MVTVGWCFVLNVTIHLVVVCRRWYSTRPHSTKWFVKSIRFASLIGMLMGMIGICISILIAEPSTYMFALVFVWMIGYYSIFATDVSTFAVGAASSIRVGPNATLDGCICGSTLQLRTIHGNLLQGLPNKQECRVCTVFIEVGTECYTCDRWSPYSLRRWVACHFPICIKCRHDLQTEIQTSYSIDATIRRNDVAETVIDFDLFDERSLNHLILSYRSGLD